MVERFRVLAPCQACLSILQVIYLLEKVVSCGKGLRTDREDKALRKKPAPTLSGNKHLRCLSFLSDIITLTLNVRPSVCLSVSLQETKPHLPLQSLSLAAVSKPAGRGPVLPHLCPPLQL